MAHLWWNVDTYSHILLVPFIAGWLAWERRDDLRAIDGAPSWLGIAAFGLACLIWLAGRASGLNLVAHAGAVAMLPAAALAVLGVRITALLAFPLAFLAFLVPFGDEIVPALQQLTAKLAIALTRASGVPAAVEGIYIDTPAGLFIVAEACSGVRFLIASVAIAVLVCFTAFSSWKRRAAFMVAAVVVPILANGVRAWGTIYVAQSQGVEFAAGFDHIVYGWIFFALVLALLLGAARPFFERTPDEAGLTVAEVRDSAWLDPLTRFDARSVAFGAAFVAIAAAAAIAARLLAG